MKNECLSLIYNTYMLLFLQRKEIHKSKLYFIAICEDNIINVLVTSDVNATLNAGHLRSVGQDDGDDGLVGTGCNQVNLKKECNMKAIPL